MGALFELTVWYVDVRHRISVWVGGKNLVIMTLWRRKTQRGGREM